MENAAGRLQVVAGSYHLTPEVGDLPWWAMFTAIPKGQCDALDGTVSGDEAACELICCVTNTASSG